jgi:hypothetical protein
VMLLTVKEPPRIKQVSICSCVVGASATIFMCY